MTGVNMWWVYLAPQNILRAIMLTLGNKIVLYCTVLYWMNEHCLCVLCVWGTVAVGVAGRRLDADDLGMAAVCRQVLQWRPACSSSSTAAMGSLAVPRLCWRLGQFNRFLTALTQEVLWKRFRTNHATILSTHSSLSMYISWCGGPVES